MARPRPEPRPGGKIVELVNLPSRFEADLLMARLDEAGIQSMAKYGDADGMAPSIGLLDGYRVCVFDDDLGRAEVLLDDLTG
ncbi:MAG: putative signal transducing protein [Acidimicrobiia bacterium]